MEAHIKSLLRAPLGEFGIEDDVDPIFHPYDEDEGFSPQSGTINDSHVSETSLKDKFQNVQFRDQMPSYDYVVDSEIDDTRKLQDMNDASLQDFFSRPIKIQEYQWGTGVTLSETFTPWQDYFRNKRVVNRINNFNLGRAKLRVKVVVNGNGFYYGRAILSYLPLATHDNLSTVTTLVKEDLVQATQLPHIYIDPTTSTGGEMVLPFFYYRNYIQSATSQWGDLGECILSSFTDLKHANGATGTVTISVFAWAEDVELTVLTSEDSSALIPQSGKESEVDEANKSGMISKPATAIAKMAGMLATAPVIGPYAMATSTAANAIGNIAKQFGYCRPTVTENPAPRRLFPTSQFATTNTPDTALKMTVDDKQELSIDPRLAGLGTSDSLSIKEIAKRESYLTQFTWAVGTASETMLWNSRISPVLWAEDTSAITGFHFPACCMAAMPFKYWTGTMRFRFQIVCSAFHKGRLKIVYDPNFMASNEYNINYMQIVDIADKSDFTLEIGNGQQDTLLDRANPGLDSVTTQYGTTTFASDSFGNGVLAVYIVNELTVPNSTTNNDIQINVFVSMGDDFEVYVPDDHFQAFKFTAQSGEEEQIPDSFNTSEPSAPYQEDGEMMGPKMTNTDKLSAVFTGESIQSFRTMLKRYNLWRRQWLGGTTGGVIMKAEFALDAFPFLRGDTGQPIDFSTTGPYNYANTVLLHWVTLAFQGWRGSIRYKLLRQAPGLRNEASIYVERKPMLDFGSATLVNIAYTPPTSTGTGAKSAIYDGTTAVGQMTGVNGLVYADTSVNPTAEFEVPYYSPYRFDPGKRKDHVTPRYPGEGFLVNSIGNCDENTIMDIHVAAGEDFQVYMWTGLPTMYYEATAPPAQ